MWFVFEVHLRLLKSRDFVREKIRGSCGFFIKEIGLKHLNFLIYGFFLFIGINNH